MDWPIQDIARMTGTTSRTLRHYEHIGLLTPSRTGTNGYRYYDATALVRLQRILLLRELGLGLPAIKDVLDRSGGDAIGALRTHLQWLHAEQERIGRQITSVTDTLEKLEGGEQLMAEDMFNGFDHTQYKEEVEQRWGAEAYADGDKWWRSMSDAEKSDWQRHMQQLCADWSAAAERGVSPDSAEAQDLAQRQFDWLAGIPGTPGGGQGAQGGGQGGPTKEYFVGLGEMYVADPRFGANYGGQTGAEFVRDAMTVYAERNL
ncbi:MAG TPA: MerR family transcriptional regulator [Arthrobacter sp.]|nr:MerR family transcriptional regulator [Arthrobacter sp.]